MTSTTAGGRISVGGKRDKAGKVAKMDRQRVIELLKQKSKEAVYVASLPYNNNEYLPWRRNIEDILESAFGVTSTEYKRVADVHMTTKGTREAIQRTYVALVHRIQQEVDSIIQKYEILGIKEKPAPIADYTEKIESKESELILQGTPDMIIVSISNVVKNLNSQGYKYGFHRTSGRPDYTKWDKTYFASYAISEGTEEKIGTISLQLIPNDRTLLKTPHPKDWDSSFKYFLDALFAEFEQLGYIKKEKTAIVESLPPEVLSAKANWKDINKEFGITKMSFGRKINFVTDPFKRTIIFRDVEQAFILASSGFSKPAVILAGSVIEELLRLYLEYKNISPISNNFDGYIKTCEQKGLLKSGISRLSDSVRHFRNLVHLSKEETKRYTISKSTAKGAVASIFTIANDF